MVTKIQKWGNSQGLRFSRTVLQQAQIDIGDEVEVSVRGRPALVVSNTLFNRHTGLAIVCPITITDRPIPFHVPVPAGSSLTGYIMVEQVKSIDYHRRKVKFVEKAPAAILTQVLGILDACLY
jgi:mRNA interferase MazF